METLEAHHVDHNHSSLQPVNPLQSETLVSSCDFQNSDSINHNQTEDADKKNGIQHSETVASGQQNQNSVLEPTNGHSVGTPSKNSLIKIIQKPLLSENVLTNNTNSGTDKDCSGGEEETTSRRRRKSRWDPPPNEDGGAGSDGTGAPVTRKRKSRWADDEPKPIIQLPDFMKDFAAGFEFDPEVQALNSRLLEISRKFQSGLPLDDRPEGARSPSPEPIYDNLGIRINTREFRARERLSKERQEIIAQIIKRNPSFKPPADYRPPKLPVSISMDIDPPVPPTSAPKKPKFAPKAPSRRKTGRLLPKNDDDAEADPELLRKLRERHGTRKPKVETESSGNVTTSSHGAGSSSTLRPKDVISKNSPDFRDTAQKSIMISNLSVEKDGDFDEMLVDRKFKSSKKIKKKKYKERWDPHSNYPITLPWRPLGSGNPEILNEQEFGEEKEYDENKINSASELGLLEKNDEKKMILFKFPQKLPLDNKQKNRVPVSAKGKEKEDASSSHKFVSDLNELPNGKLGKMLVYKSGAIKFKLGDIIFDVSSGVLDECAQDVTLMNTKNKNCCVLGQVDKQAVIVPDLDSLLDNIAQQ